MGEWWMVEKCEKNKLFSGERVFHCSVDDQELESLPAAAWPKLPCTMKYAVRLGFHNYEHTSDVGAT